VDQSILIHLHTTATGADAGIIPAANLTAFYWRAGDAPITAIPLSDLADGSAAHTDGGLVALYNGNYRLDLPDVVVAGGVDYAQVYLSGPTETQTGGGYTIDLGGSAVDQQPIPAARTAIVITKAGVGNVGERSLTLTVGELQPIAVDYRKLLPTNGRVTAVTCTQLTQPVGGSLTIGTTGYDKTQAKVPLTPDTAGTYTMECVATFADGAGQEAATVTLVVV